MQYGSVPYQPIFPTTNQQSAASGYKILIYGKSGTMKTRIASTASQCLIIATEPGLLSLQDFAVPFWYCRTLDELFQAVDWMERAPEARMYRTFHFDSLAEILEMVIADELPKAGKEPRRAYNQLLIRATELIKRFRDVQGPNIVFTAKETRDRDDSTGGMIYQPSFPGKAVGMSAPYLFDFVFNIYTQADPVSGEVTPLLRTRATASHDAKDRSGRLAPIEYANLDYLFQKIQGA